MLGVHWVTVQMASSARVLLAPFIDVCFIDIRGRRWTSMLLMNGWKALLAYSISLLVLLQFPLIGELILLEDKFVDCVYFPHRWYTTFNGTYHRGAFDDECFMPECLTIPKSSVPKAFHLFRNSNRMHLELENVESHHLYNILFSIGNLLHNISGFNSDWHCL